MEEMAATQHALAASEERLIKGTLDARRHEPTASIDHAAGGDEVWFPGCEAAGQAEPLPERSLCCALRSGQRGHGSAVGRKNSKRHLGILVLQ